MKILILQDYLRSGGTERQSILLANAFAAAGHETTLLTFRPGGTLSSTVNPSVRRASLQSFDFYLDWFAPGLLRFVSQAAPEVILCMGRMANCYALKLRTSLTKPPKIVLTMRTGKSLPARFRAGLLRADRVVANSAEARETLIKSYSVPAAKISVVHNALVFPPEAALTRNLSLRVEYGATPGTTVLLCVAMFRPEKNQRELIEIAAQLPPNLDWQLWLAGDGPARAACEQLVAAKNLAARIKFLGFHRDPSPLYAAADIAVHASWSEALSNFLIEAQAHGLPVVAYEAQGIRECFVSEKTGWAISRNDRAAFITALTRLAAVPPSARASLANEAKNYARTTFDPARQVQAYLDLFTQLVRTGQP